MGVMACSASLDLNGLVQIGHLHYLGHILVAGQAQVAAAERGDLRIVRCVRVVAA